MSLPEGWPTEEMIQAGAKVAESYDKYVKGMPEYRVIAKEILEAALAAVLTPPAQEDDIGIPPGKGDAADNLRAALEGR